MEAFLSNASGSSENVENSHGDFDYGLLPAFSASSLRSEIPERLLEDDASTLSPSHIEQNISATHNFLQENACSPQEQPLQQDYPTQQEEVAFLRHEDTQGQPEDVSESSTALFQEQTHAETGQDVRKLSRKPYSWKEKLGTFAIVGLIAGSVLLCAAIGTLAFIWFGSPAIPAWKEITARNWLSKAISICVGVIQQVMMLQLGIVTATLASLALESRDVVISDVASVSAMRATATSTGAFVMAWQYLSGGSYRTGRHSSNIFLILSAALLWCLSQFLLFIILTDVSLRSTPGLASPATLSYSSYFNITPRGSGVETVSTQFQEANVGPWYRKASSYASFAEYSEPPYEAADVSDTGVTLRASLPFGTAQDRENLESYRGKSTVLDARVTCQVPQVKNATIDSDLRFREFLAATRNTPRLANLSLDKGSGAKDPAGIGFDCFIASESGPSMSPWSLSLCQLWNDNGINITDRFGGLYSEFQNPSTMGGTNPQGSAYLFSNITLGIIPRIMSPPTTFVAEASQERGEWLDLIYLNGSVTISASICYAAYDFADIDVSISSQSNRTEFRLAPVFDGAKFTYTFQELRNAMGQDRSLSRDRRGILELAKGTLQLAPDEDPVSQLFLAYHLRKTADLAFTIASEFNSQGHSFATCLLCRQYPCGLQDDCILPEDMHVSTFPDYMNLPYQVGVTLLGLRSFDVKQIMECGRACPGGRCPVTLHSHQIDALFL